MVRILRKEIERVSQEGRRSETKRGMSRRGIRGGKTRCCAEEEILGQLARVGVHKGSLDDAEQHVWNLDEKCWLYQPRLSSFSGEKGGAAYLPQGEEKEHQHQRTPRYTFRSTYLSICSVKILHRRSYLGMGSALARRWKGHEAIDCKILLGNYILHT